MHTHTDAEKWRNTLKKIKKHIDEGVVFSVGAKKEMNRNWKICKFKMSRVSDSMKNSVERLQKEYDKLFEI